MAATKNDDLFEKVGNLIMEIAQVEGEHALDEVELMELFQVQQHLCELWDNYLDRLIFETVKTSQDVETLKAAGANVKEVEAAKKRVRARLVKLGPEGREPRSKLIH